MEPLSFSGGSGAPCWLSPNLKGAPMFIHRRNFVVISGGLCLALTTAKGQPAPQSRPVLWRVKKGNPQTFILGFSDAPDHGWLPPAIQQAFQESAEIWFETPPPDPAP